MGDRGGCNAKKHRGFGFVIFSDKNAVDNLLGEDTSRFITVGDGLRFEVKRAVGKFAGVGLTPDRSQAPHGTPSEKKHTGSPSHQSRSGTRGASVEASPVLSGSYVSAKMPPVP